MRFPFDRALSHFSLRSIAAFLRRILDLIRFANDRSGKRTTEGGSDRVKSSGPTSAGSRPPPPAATILTDAAALHGLKGRRHAAEKKDWMPEGWKRERMNPEEDTVSNDSTTKVVYMYTAYLCCVYVFLCLYVCMCVCLYVCMFVFVPEIHLNSSACIGL